MTGTCDIVLSVCNSFGYDEFNRQRREPYTRARCKTTYTFDRYGNRRAQNAPQGGPTLSISFNKGNNIINASGFSNDAAGNIGNDTLHQYAYEAGGNLILVDNGSTGKYYYDSLNQRVQIAAQRGTFEFVWDIFGRRVSTWFASNHGFIESNAYTDSGPIAIRGGGSTQFEHQNWLGTERVRTNYRTVAISLHRYPGQTATRQAATTATSTTLPGWTAIWKTTPNTPSFANTRPTSEGGKVRTSLPAATT